MTPKTAAVVVVLGVTAISLNGCEVADKLMNLSKKADFITKSCKSKVEETLSSDKEEYIDELSAKCPRKLEAKNSSNATSEKTPKIDKEKPEKTDKGEPEKSDEGKPEKTQDTFDLELDCESSRERGEKLVHAVYHGIVAKYTGLCIAEIMKEHGIDNPGEFNESTSVIPEEVDEFVESNEEDMKKSIEEMIAKAAELAAQANSTLHDSKKQMESAFEDVLNKSSAFKLFEMQHPDIMKQLRQGSNAKVGLSGQFFALVACLSLVASVIVFSTRWSRAVRTSWSQLPLVNADDEEMSGEDAPMLHE